MTKQVRPLSFKKQRVIKGGFTAIELMIAVAIMVILAVAALPIYTNFKSSAQLHQETTQLIQTLRIARERSSANLNDARHGVKMENSRYILYQGASYDSRDNAYDNETILDKSLSLSWNIGNQGDLNFSVNSGLPNSTGTVSISHQSKGNVVISINELGLAQRE